MSEGQTKNLRRLHWRFWLVLFAPAMISVTAPVTTYWLHPYNVLGGMAFVNLAVALPVNFICCNWAAKQVVLLRDTRGGSSPWMFLWGPLFFFLNVVVAFGGCAASARIAQLTR